MASKKAQKANPEIMHGLKVGDAIELPSPLRGLSTEKVLATVVSVHEDIITFDASLFGVHVGMMEYRPGRKSTYWMDP